MIPQYDGLPCEETTARKDKDGYGVLPTGVGGKPIKAHRKAAMEAYGPPPEGKPLACHTCDNPPCIRPSHLFWGSYLDNNRDRTLKGRTAAGERNGHTHLTSEQVLEMRRLAIIDARGRVSNASVLSSIFGLDRHAVTSIVNRVSWKSV